VASIERGDPTGRIPGTRYLVVRPNRLGFGLDVGWGVWDRDGVFCHLWWGNTRDQTSLTALADDCRRRGEVFEGPVDTKIEQ
jgi:hypothetical protein